MKREFTAEIASWAIITLAVIAIFLGCNDTPQPAPIDYQAQHDSLYKAIEDSINNLDSGSHTDTVR